MYPTDNPCFFWFLKESSKISDLNPNAKAWANYMPKPEASAPTCPDSQQSWVEAADDPSNCISGGTPPNITVLKSNWCIPSLSV